MTAPEPREPQRVKDWLEDAAHENGQYENICHLCGRTFTGHKRRVTCKGCVEQRTTNPASPLPEEPPAPRPEYELDQLLEEFRTLIETPSEQQAGDISSRIRALFDRQRKDGRAEGYAQAAKDALMTGYAADERLKESPETFRYAAESRLARINELESSLERLKAEQLTDEEARAVLADPGSDDPLYEAWRSAILKIRRRLSQSDTGAQP